MSSSNPPSEKAVLTLAAILGATLVASLVVVGKVVLVLAGC